MAFPTTLDSFPSSATLAAHNLDTDPHSTLHGNLGSAIAALEAKLGVDSSAVTSSVDYKINHLGGDLTGTVTSATIANAAVTLAKQANLAANSIIGNNTASPATPIALTTTQVKSLLAIANTDVSGLGTMSVVNSPVPVANGGTASTTTQAALDTLAGGVTNNQVLAGNGTHVTLRALASADIPALDFSKITTGTVPINQGGTAQTTAAAARGSSGLNVEGYTTVADVDTTIASTARYVAYTSLTATRTATLPAANSVSAGYRLCVADASGSASGTVTITLARAGTDTIDNGLTSWVLAAPNHVAELISDGVSHWNVDNGHLAVFHNLSDLASVPTSKTNLKVGYSTRRWARNFYR